MGMLPEASTENVVSTHSPYSSAINLTVGGSALFMGIAYTTIFGIEGNNLLDSTGSIDKVSFLLIMYVTGRRNNILCVPFCSRGS